MAGSHILKAFTFFLGCSCCSGARIKVHDVMAGDTVPTCPSSIFNGFCDPTDVAGGAACIFDGLLNEDGHLTDFIKKPEQIQCVPKKNGGAKYACPAGMTKCIVDGPTPSHECPSAIFDGYCDKGDIAGGAACIHNAHWQDGLLKSAITKPSQVQCVPKRNGGVDYECPDGMHKCFVDDIPSANIQKDFVAAPTCPSSIFNGFCDPTDVAGGAACIYKNLLDKDGHLTDFITEPEQIQCVPKKNGGVNGGKYTCPATMTKCIVDGPTPSHECPDAIFDGYCDLADIAGGAACIMNEQWQDGLLKSTIKKPEQVQCVPIKNGGVDYTCPAGMNKCLVGANPDVKPDGGANSDVKPDGVVAPTTCPSSIFDGFCDPKDVAGGAACIFDGLLNEDGHLKNFITKPEQIQCVPETNGGVNYVCPAGMTKCIVDGPAPSHKCPSAIFDGFCDQDDIAGGAACIDNGHWQDGLTKHVISKPSQVQCVPIKNGGVDYKCPAGMNKCYVGASPSANIQRKQEMTHHSLEIDLAEGGYGLNATGARYATNDEITISPGTLWGAYQNPTSWQRYYNFKFTAENVYKFAGDTESHFQLRITCDSAEHYEPAGCYVAHDQGHILVSNDISPLSFKCRNKFRFDVKNVGDRCGAQSGDIRLRKVRWEWDQVSS